MSEVYAILIDIIKPAVGMASFFAMVRIGWRIIYNAFSGKERFL